MTWIESQERAERIWGLGVLVGRLATPKGHWYVEVPGDTGSHRLDAHGHVFCRHQRCRDAERNADANQR